MSDRQPLRPGTLGIITLLLMASAAVLTGIAVGEVPVPQVLTSLVTGRTRGAAVLAGAGLAAGVAAILVGAVGLVRLLSARFPNAGLLWSPSPVWSPILMFCSGLLLFPSNGLFGSILACGALVQLGSVLSGLETRIAEIEKRVGIEKPTGVPPSIVLP